MKKVVTILVGVVVLTLFGGTIYFLWAKSQKPDTVFLTESPKKATIIKKAVATGAVVPRQEVEIKPRVSGIVEQVFVEAGQLIQEGALIARIRLVPDMVNLSNAQNRVTRAEIGLENARQEFERNCLHADGLISQAAFQPSTRARTPSGVGAAREKSAHQKDLGGLQRSNTLVPRRSGQVSGPVEVGHSVIETNTFTPARSRTVADIDE